MGYLGLMPLAYAVVCRPIVGSGLVDVNIFHEGCLRVSQGHDYPSDRDECNDRNRHVAHRRCFGRPQGSPLHHKLSLRPANPVGRLT